jgi:transglutaminase/protease-like cytokinesis protein 3
MVGVAGAVVAFGVVGIVLFNVLQSSGSNTTIASSDPSVVNQTATLRASATIQETRNPTVQRMHRPIRPRNLARAATPRLQMEFSPSQPMPQTLRQELSHRSQAMTQLATLSERIERLLRLQPPACLQEQWQILRRPRMLR